MQERFCSFAIKPTANSIAGMSTVMGAAHGRWLWCISSNESVSIAIEVYYDKNKSILI